MAMYLADVFTRIRAEVHSGFVAAKSMPIGPASYEVEIAARSDPTSSITHESSSTKDSQGGRASSGSGSDAPVPRRSNRIRRTNDVRRRRKSSAAGSSQSVSNAPKLPEVRTRSLGPVPTTS